MTGSADAAADVSAASAPAVVAADNIDFAASPSAFAVCSLLSLRVCLIGDTTLFVGPATLQWPRPQVRVPSELLNQRCPRTHRVTVLLSL